MLSTKPFQGIPFKHDLHENIFITHCCDFLSKNNEQIHDKTNTFTCLSRCMYGFSDSGQPGHSTSLDHQADQSSLWVISNENSKGCGQTVSS